MAKRPSEAAFGSMLRAVDLRVDVERLPDPHTGAGITNWKPCDYMSWHADGDVALTTWWEVKDQLAVRGWPKSDLRPSQESGIRRAHRMGIPYRLAIWWRKHREWTISDGWRVLEWFTEHPEATSIPRELLMSRFGVSSSAPQMASVLKSVMLGEVD